MFFYLGFSTMYKKLQKCFRGVYFFMFDQLTNNFKNEIAKITKNNLTKTLKTPVRN